MCTTMQTIITKLLDHVYDNANYHHEVTRSWVQNHANYQVLLF